MEEIKQVVNRKYKDSVFVDLFSNDQTASSNFLSLYNALHGTNLDSAVPLKALRLEQVMYMAFYNDVSYLVDNKMIVLVEHQSTINPNMPIRCLEYVVRLYEMLLDSQERYARQIVKIPTPEFYVFYNGKEEYPSETVLQLSDAFMTKEEERVLELKVRVLNINKSKGNKLLESCKALGEYSTFVEIVRRNIEADRENGFNNAIKECMREGILKEYLKRKASEVINMLLAEYDYETDIAVQREEAGRIAFASGIEQGKSLGLAEGKSLGLAEGKLETARLMKQANCEVAFIVQMTGLTRDAVEALGNS